MVHESDTQSDWLPCDTRSLATAHMMQQHPLVFTSPNNSRCSCVASTAAGPSYISGGKEEGKGVGKEEGGARES